MAEVLLINCRTQGLVTKVEHLGLGYLASVVASQGWRAEVLDASFHNLGRAAVCREVLRRQPRLVGFTVYYNNIRETLGTAAALRKSGYSGHLCLGGHHATFLAQAILTDRLEIDSVILGEGEGALVELAGLLLTGKDWGGLANLAYRGPDGVVVNPCRLLIPDLDVLPWPSRDCYAEFLQREKMASLVSSRGCYGSCGFCSIRSFYRLAPGKIWRGRNPGKVVDEIEDLVARYGVKRINFVDDEFMGAGAQGRERAWAIGEELLRRKQKIAFNIVCRPDSLNEEVLRFLQSAGLYHISVGLESWVPRQLALYNKKTSVQDNRRAIAILDRLGIDYMFFLIPADPYVSVEELWENLEKIEAAGVTRAAEGFVFSQLMVLPGTSLEKRFAQEGLLRSFSPQKSYLGLQFYEFQDERIKHLYRDWQPVLQDYAELRTWFSKLKLKNLEDEERKGFHRYCQQELHQSIFTMFKKLVGAARNGVRVNVAALARTEFDHLILERLLGRLSQESRARRCEAEDGPLTDPAAGGNHVWNILKSGLESTRRRLLELLLTEDGHYAISDRFFVDSLHWAWRYFSLSLQAQLFQVCVQGRPQGRARLVQRGLDRLNKDLEGLIEIMRLGVFRRFESQKIRFAGSSLLYPSPQLRRLMRQVMRQWQNGEDRAKLSAGRSQ